MIIHHLEEPMMPLDGARFVTQTRRTYLMCPPEYFAVEYAINPWMNPDQPVDLALARRQWEQLRSTYLRLGHAVRIIDPVPGLPDMVFAANGSASGSSTPNVSRRAPST
jgi:N-dimethylarginine dimethylaminohydrolase